MKVPKPEALIPRNYCHVSVAKTTDDEFRNLKWNMVNAKARPHVEAAYMYVKDGYPTSVQKYWEGLDMSNSPSYAFGELLEAGRA